MPKPVDKAKNRAKERLPVRMRRLRAFTLLEILTVIGIIAILVTLVVLGVNSIGTGSRERATQVTMENLKSLVGEAETTGGLSEINKIYVAAPLTPFAAGDVQAGPARVASYHPTTGAPQNALAATQLTMQRLSAIPANRQRLANFPSNQLLPVSAVPVTGAAPAGITAPFVLDAWGNPIIYVPAGGLTSLYVSGSPSAVTKSAPGGRGFWASAGPDGVFGGYNDRDGNGNWDADKDTGYGDDNVYSFEN